MRRVSREHEVESNPSSVDIDLGCIDVGFWRVNHTYKSTHKAERKNERVAHTHTHAHTHTERDRETEREGEGEREREMYTHTHIHTHTEGMRREESRRQRESR